MDEPRPAASRPRTAVIPFPRRGLPRLELARLAPSGRSLLVGACLVAAAAGAYTLARETPMFAVDGIEVRGGTPAVQAEVRGALAPLLGTSLLALDLGTVDRRLGRLPDIAGGSYDRDFPHTLRVFVRPERAVAVLRRADRSWLVSARGRVIGTVDRRRAPALPRIWIARSVDVAVGDTLAPDAGGRAVQAVAPLAAASFPARVLLVRADEHQLTLVLRSGLEVRLGEPSRLRLKLEVARRILPTIAGAGPGAYLDVTVPERPVGGDPNPQVTG